MNAQEAMNRVKLGRLRRQLQSGAISPQQLERRLSHAIEREMQKGAKRMDVRFISACEDLLWQLNAPATAHIPSNKRAGWLRLQHSLHQLRQHRPYWPRLRTAALAASMLLVLAGGLWLAGQRPPAERKHSSLHSPFTPAPDGEGRPQGLTASPLPAITAAPTPTSTPNPTPTPTPVPTPAPTLEATSMPPSPPPVTARPDARAKYRSMAQLKAEAPARWQGSYHAHGRDIEVDVPIVLPDVEEIAALKLHWLDMKGLVFGEDNSIRNSLIKRYPENHLTLVDGFMGSLNMHVSSTERRYFYGPKDAHGDVMVLPGQPAADNPYPVDKPFQLLQQTLRSLGVSVDHIQLDAQAGTSGFYYMRHLRGNETLPDIPFAQLDRQRPAPGYERGYYKLSAMQVVQGLPLFPMEYIHASQPGEPYDLQSYILMKVLDEENFDLGLRLVNEAGIRQADLPLMNMQAVIESAEAMIESGHLRRVDSLELGYMLYYAQHLSGQQKQSVSDELVALPVWRLRGIMMQNPSQEVSQGVLDEADSSLTREYSDSSFELRFNAQTGEYISPVPNQAARANPAILSWEQMEQSENDIELF